MGKFMQNIDDMQQNQNITGSQVEPNLVNAFCYARHQSIRMYKRLKILVDDAKIYDTLDNMMKFMLSNPLLMVAFIIVTATLVLPIVFFTIFAVINVSIVFTSFIIIEVMLMMIGMTVLCSVMFFIITTLVVVGITFILSLYIIYLTCSLVKKKLRCK